MKWTPIVAIIALLILACFALYLGINGAVFITASAAIAGLGGYELKSWQTKKEDKTRYVEDILRRAGYTDRFISQVIKKARGGE